MDEVFGLFPTPFMRAPGTLALPLVTRLVEHFTAKANNDNNSSANLSHTEMLRPNESPLFAKAAELVMPKLVEYGADRRVLVPGQWGYLPGANKPAAGRARKPLINVRGEQVASGHGFRDAFASRRCRSSSAVSRKVVRRPPATRTMRPACSTT